MCDRQATPTSHMGHIFVSMKKPFSGKTLMSFQIEGNLKMLPRRRQLLPELSDLFVLKLVSIGSTGVQVLRGDIRNQAEHN